MMEPADKGSSADWTAEYYHQQALVRKNRSVRTLLQPSVLGACLAIAGRIVFGPLVIAVLFLGSNYLSSATVLIKSDNSFFAFTENDMSMAGGCTACIGPCRIVLLKYQMFNGSAFISGPQFKAFGGQGSDPSLYDFSSLSAEALALADALDADDNVICQSGNNEWGSTTNIVTGTAQQVMDVIEMVDLSVAPQMKRELKLGIEQDKTNECATVWNMIAITRLFQYPTVAGNAIFAKIPAVDLNLFPSYTECRPQVTIDDSLVGSKLALATNGEDLLSAYPEILTLFPYSFTSSIPPVSRVVPSTNTYYPSETVLQPLLRGYYGACRVRAVNTTGIYIEDTCEVSTRWANYGLMVHSPDDVPLCSTGDVCIHNYFNSLWEWVNYINADNPTRVGMNLNTFRSRYADTVGLSVLPGVVVMQMLLMGVISLYQVMSHKRSVLLTQIWAYRCQNGRMQVVYLAQITYHLVYNSDLYLIGLATGTLTTESIANLVFCFFAFSYSFINLLKARSGDQVLDRHFRLTWEAMQLVITSTVAAILFSVQRTPQEYIITKNGELLRKTSAKGAKYCGLNDACLLFTFNMPTIVAVLSVGLGVVALITSIIVKKLSPTVKSAVRSARLSMATTYGAQSRGSISDSATRPKVIAADKNGKQDSTPQDKQAHLTSFERNCIGAPFKKLFRDCDDIAYVMYNGKRCTTVEALLLTGYLYYGQHIYQASSVMMLLISRVIPRKVLRTFNMLLLRWHMDPKDGTLSHVLSCTWYTASKENHQMAGATPVA